MALLLFACTIRRGRGPATSSCASVHEPADTQARDCHLAALCPAKVCCCDAQRISLPYLSPRHRTVDSRLLLPRHHSEKKSVFEPKVCVQRWHDDNCCCCCAAGAGAAAAARAQSKQSVVAVAAAATAVVYSSSVTQARTPCLLRCVYRGW